METIIVHVLEATLRFAKNTWGIISTPYQTYRHFAKNSDLYDLVPLFALIFGYFLLVSPLRSGSLHPFLLTYNFGLLSFGFVCTYLLVVLGIYLVGRLFGGTDAIRAVALSWGYSLIPTLIWFIMTTFFYVVLPPPRNLTILGTLFSVVFFSASLMLFFWKGILYYLTLRFALRLDFLRIMGASMIIFPLGIVYALIMHDMGIFRVPFI